MARKRKPKQHVFIVGDLALYIYEAKGKTYVTPVEVCGTRRYPINPGVKNKRQLRYSMEYQVTTNSGGTMMAGPDSLRPDTVLDRIDLALSKDD